MSSRRADVASANERVFVRDALAGGLRVDGRGPLDMRAVGLTWRPGAAEVQLGRTRVLAVVTADMVEPFPDRPAEGFLAFYVNFSPMASPHFEASGGRQPERATELCRVLERAVRDSRALDVEGLCILAGSRVWSVRCDVHVLDHDGNLTDCAALAAVAALLHFRRPDVTVVGERVTVHSVEDRQPVPLSLHHLPLCVTVGFVEAAADGEPPLLVVDPSLKEELCMAGSVTLTLNAHKELCAVQKAGGVPVPMEMLVRCTQIAAAKAELLNEMLERRAREAQEEAAARSGNARPIDAFGAVVTKQKAAAA